MPTMNMLFSAGIALLLSVLTGCSEQPVPPEVQLAFSQAEDLRRAGAAVYAPDSYADYLASIQSGREQLAAERSRPAWFREYAGVAAGFHETLVQGEQVAGELVRNQRQQHEELRERSGNITDRLRALRELNGALKDKRLNTGSLSRIEVLLAEANSFDAKQQPQAALARLDEAGRLLEQTVAVIRPLLARYLDEEQMLRSVALVDEAVAESRRRGGQTIVINKLRRQLILYDKGSVAATYPVGLGFNPIDTKLYAGDRATPEGRYQVSGKLPHSNYFRALLINYPNADDQRRFAEAKRSKLISANAAIGGSIEIHGGGKDSTTLGCIGLNDNHMRELFDRIEIGTPVVIVAFLQSDNLVRLALGRLQ